MRACCTNRRQSVITNSPTAGLFSRLATTLVRTQYAGTRKRKVRPRKSALRSEGTAIVAVLPCRDLAPDVAQSFQEQIRDGKARFLWRYSTSVTFHQVMLSGEPFNVGYSRTRREFFLYDEPPETKPELLSSARLLTGSPEAIDAVQEAVRTGKAEC